MEVSFIIPHKGRHAMLVKTVASIAQQDYDIQRIEVIVVSQNTEINLQTFNDIAFKNLKIIVAHHNGDTISAMRNHGFTLAQGNYIAFIDADVELSANWLQVMFLTLKQDNVVMSSAMQIAGSQPTALESIRVALSNVHIDCDLQFLPGRNLFLARQYVKIVGGFPEHLITCEDYYFTQKVAEHGRLRYVSGAEYVHIGEDKDFTTLWEKEIWRGQSNLQSLSGRKFTLSEVPSLLSPVGLAFCLLAAVVSGLIGQFAWLFFWFVCACLPILVYSLRLKLGSGKKLSMVSIMQFYSVYFPARAVGTLTGLFKKLGAGKRANAN